MGGKNANLKKKKKTNPTLLAENDFSLSTHTALGTLLPMKTYV